MQQLSFGLLFVIVAVSFASAQRPQDMERQLRAAQHAEIFEGLSAGIERYRHVAETGVPPYAGQALLRMADAYRRLGNTSAQIEALERVGRDHRGSAEAAKAREALQRLQPSQESFSKEPPGLTTQTLWRDAITDTTGHVSFDGRYLSFVDRTNLAGGLALRDLTNGTNRVLRAAGTGIAGPSAISRDARFIAYAWRPNVESTGELRVIATDGSHDRLLFGNAAVDRVHPMDWTPDGKKVLALLSTRTGASRISLIDLDNGWAQHLTTIVGSRVPQNMSVSPDGRFIAYDIPQNAGSPSRDISVLDTGGFREFTLVAHPGHDYVLGWTPDSKRLLFASDRSGSVGIWSVETIDGKIAELPPLRLIDGFGEIHSLGVTRHGALLFGLSGGKEVQSLEGILPELAKLQQAALQQPQQPAPLAVASVEGIVVKYGTDEPVRAADVELIRLEGTSASPLTAGAADAFAAIMNTARLPQGVDVAPALVTEAQYTKTDDRGRFSFRNLKPGRYRLASVLVPSSLYPAEYGQRDPRGRGYLFSVADGQTVSDLRLEMAPSGTITGRVTDADGEPMGHINVIALRSAYRDGKQVFQLYRIAKSNARGEYRLYWLAPGAYVVAAVVEETTLPGGAQPPGRLEGIDRIAVPLVSPRILATGEVVEETFRPVYYGNAVVAAQARTVEIRPDAASFNGADIAMSEARTRSYRIRGTLINGFTNQPAAGVQIRAVPGNAGSYSMIPTAVSDANGAFDLKGIVPGAYTLFAPIQRVTPAPANARAAIVSPALGIVSLEVTGDTDGLQILAAPIPDLQGQLRIEGTQRGGQPADLANLRIGITREPDIWGAPYPDGSANNAQFNSGQATAVPLPDGSFRLAISPGNFRLTISGLPDDMYVKSMRANGVEIIDGEVRIQKALESPIEIVIGASGGEVNGLAVGRDLKTTANAVVVLIPDAPALRDRSILYKSTASDADGRFRFKGVSPGDYKLFAFDYVEPETWTDPFFLQSYESLGRTIRIVEGTRQQTQVTVIPASR